MNSTDTLDAVQLQRDLADFNGSETFTRHWTRRAVMTEGVMYLCDKAESHWLVDVIVSHQLTPSVRAEEFQTWTLTRDAQGSGAVVVATDGDEREIARQVIEFTDFPLMQVSIWFENDTLYLPSER